MNMVPKKDCEIMFINIFISLVFIAGVIFVIKAVYESSLSPATKDLLLGSLLIGLAVVFAAGVENENGN